MWVNTSDDMRLYCEVFPVLPEPHPRELEADALVATGKRPPSWMDIVSIDVA